MIENNSISIKDFSNKQIIAKYLDKYKDSIQSVRMRDSSLNYFFKKKYFGYQDHVQKIAKNNLYDYFYYLKALNLTLRTKQNKWIILKSFLQFCMEYYSDFLIMIPSKTINWGIHHKDSNSNKTVLATEDELKRILNYLLERNYRFYLIFRMFQETGMRKGELINAEYKNINMEIRYIRVKGKTGEKVYFFSKDCAKHLKMYLENRESIKSDEPYLFLTNRLNKYNNRQFNQILKGEKGVLKALGIKKDITCHTFRRTLNTLRKTKLNCPVEDRKNLIGHKTSDTNIADYTILDYQEKLALYDKYYPY